jgi:hypothetical protein
MKRRIVIALLGLGAVGGYSAGFAHLHAWRHAHYGCPYEGSPPPGCPGSEGPGGPRGPRGNGEGERW